MKYQTRYIRSYRYGIIIMSLHKEHCYGLIEVNFSGTEFIRGCITAPTVCSMRIDAELFGTIRCNGRTDLWHFEHLISVGNTYKVTKVLDHRFGVREKFFKVDRDNPIVLYKPICGVDSSTPDMADGYRMIVHPITK